MECTIDWLAANGMAFSAETGSGHLLTMDGAPDGAGRNLAPRPMETFLTGAAACTAFDVVSILKKGRHAVTDVVVTVEGERALEAPRVFTAFHYVYTVAGHALDPKQVERAVKLSKEKYCSATIMLAKTATVTYDIVIVEGDRVPD